MCVKGYANGFEGDTKVIQDNLERWIRKWYEGDSKQSQRWVRSQYVGLFEAI